MNETNEGCLFYFQVAPAALLTFCGCLAYTPSVSAYGNPNAGSATYLMVLIIVGSVPLGVLLLFAAPWLQRRYGQRVLWSYWVVLISIVIVLVALGYVEG